MVNPVLASASISVVEPQASGMASGANNTFRQVGIATGIAILGAVFQSQIVSHTTTLLRQTAVGRLVLHQGGAQLVAAESAGEVHQAASKIPLPAARSELLRSYHVAFSATLNHLTIIGAIIAFVGVIGALLPRPPTRLRDPGGRWRRRRPCLNRSSSRGRSCDSSRFPKRTSRHSSWRRRRTGATTSGPTPPMASTR